MLVCPKQGFLMALLELLRQFHMEKCLTAGKTLNPPI
jgi:hypothetical protein